MRIDRYLGTNKNWNVQLRVLIWQKSASSIKVGGETKFIKGLLCIQWQLSIIIVRLARCHNFGQDLRYRWWWWRIWKCARSTTINQYYYLWFCHSHQNAMNVILCHLLGLSCNSKRFVRSCPMGRHKSLHSRIDNFFFQIGDIL